MSGHNVLADTYVALQSGNATVRDPGAGGTFKLNGKTGGVVTLTATGTYTLPSSPKGTVLYVAVDDTSVITLADAAGTVGSFTGTSGTTMARCQATDSNSWSFTVVSRGSTQATNLGIADAGGYTTATTVETGLQVALRTSQTIPVPFNNLFDPDGDPVVKFSAAPAPGFTILNSEAVGLKWGTHATPTAVIGTVMLPPGINSETSVETINVIASKTGATVGDAVTFLVTAFPNVVGSLHDGFTDVGGTTNAMTGNATAKTVQRVSLALQAIGDTTPSTVPIPLSFTIKPTNGTLGTDDVLVESIYFTVTNLG
jgi:hypothetical protein